MVDVDEAIITKIKSHGHDFEILVDCVNAVKLKEGKEVDIKDVLAVSKIFSDAKKGLLASEGAMKEVFKTTDAIEVAKEIIKKGEIHLTTEYKHELRDGKRKQIIDLIHKKGVDPRTNAPHPITRIENALEEAKIHVDEFRPAEAQLDDVLHKIRPILPIKIETREIFVRIPAVYAAKSYGQIKQHSKVLREEWQNDGSLAVYIEIPAGLQEEVFNQLNALTHGEVETRIIKTK